MQFLQRVLAPKSVFFRRLQALCFALAFLSLAVLIAPIQKPGLLQQTAGYLYVAATAAALVCQLTAEGRKRKPQTYGQPRTRRK